VPNLGDVTALDWAQVPPVDLVSAGWPCQDISYAGPGAGITEGTRSGLWLKIADGLRHLRPAYIFLENVAALRTRGLGKVLGDLAALGYDAQWVCLRAADAGAPHRRDRLLILGVRPGEAARLAAAADPGRREPQRRGIDPDLDGPLGPAEEARLVRTACFGSGSDPYFVTVTSPVRQIRVNRNDLSCPETGSACCA
jgi:DNA (cytosine-5)-methyltransferase 1